MRAIAYDGTWGWPPAATDYGAQAQLFTDFSGGKWNRISLHSGGTGGSWDSQGTPYTNVEGFRKWLIQTMHTDSNWSSPSSHQYNCEPWRGPRNGPGPNTGANMGPENSEADVFDLAMIYTPTGAGNYTVKGRVRMHYAASWDEMQAPKPPWPPYQWQWNKAINNVAAPDDAWFDLYDGTYQVTGFAGDVTVRMALQNWAVPQPQNWSISWDDIVVDGTVSSTPDVVWVDDDWTGPANCGGHIWGYDAFATIANGVNAVASGGTVIVAAGNYTGGIALNKPVTLEGPNAGVHGADAGRAAEAILPASYYAFSPAADNITIDGFRFQGTSNRVIDTYANANNLTIANCVFATTGGATTGTIQMGGGSHDNMVIERNLFTGVANGHCLYLAGTYANGPTIDDNAFVDCDEGLFGAAQYNNPQITNNELTRVVTGFNSGAMVNPTITGNTFTDMIYCGMQIGTEGGTVSGNTFDGASGYDFGGGVTAAYAIMLWGGAWGTWACEDLDIFNNEINNYTNPGPEDYHVGIYVTADAGPNANIHDNTMTNCGIGIRVRSSLDNTIQDNTVAGTGTYGILVTNSTAPTTLDIGSTSLAVGLVDFIRITSGATLNIDASSATFSGAADDAAREAKVWHDVDEAGVGHVDWGQGAATATNLSVQNVSGAKGATVQLAARLTAGGAALAGQAVNISVDGAAVGVPVTDANGWARIDYTITQDAGAFNIDAAFGGVFNYKAATGTGTLTVTAPAPTSITVIMAPNRVDAGATSTATVTGSNGVDYSAAATCYIQYGAGGSWAGNVYTAATAGTWTVTAVYGSLAATTTLTVEHGAAATVTLSPANASITTDQTQTYTVQATDAYGNSWVPTISGIGRNGYGTVNCSFPFQQFIYEPAAADGGSTVWFEVIADNTLSNRAYLDVISSGSGGTPLILAWDKDTATFYLCTDAANPQTGTALVIGNNTVGTVTVTVAKTGSSSTDLVATVTNGGAPTNSLRVRWYLRSGAVDKCYSYSTINGTTHTAVYSLGRTSVDGGRSQVGFFGLAHNLNADPPTAITYSVVQQ